MIETFNKSIDNMPKEDKDGHYQPTQRTNKAYPGRTIPDIPGVQCSGISGKAYSGAPRVKAMGTINSAQEGERSTSLCLYWEAPGQEESRCAFKPIPERFKGTGSGQGSFGCSRARTSLAKKKSELGLKGPLNGHFKKEIREAVVKAIKEAMAQGLTQSEACKILDISTRKYRRWANPKPRFPRIAWNKILPQERDAILQAAWDEKFWGKPLSHIFVYGHESRRYCVSLSTIYNVLAEAKLVRPKIIRKNHQPYINAHKLLDEGFSLLCYDATRFVTDSNVGVWAIPVLLLPYRYLFHIGHVIHSVRSNDLVNIVEQACSSIPESIASTLLAYSDRGSAMKSSYTQRYLTKNLNLPVHFGRPHTPDDQAWIEAFIKTLKYHRDAPSHFPQVADVIDWFQRFPSIYNYEPHSSLSYVTPAQTLAGLKEVILNQRKQNLYEARQARLAAYRGSEHWLPEVVSVSK